MGKERVKFFQLRLKYIIEGLSGSKIFALTGSQKKVMADFNNYNFKISNISTSVGFRNNTTTTFELFILLIVVLFFFCNKTLRHQRYCAYSWSFFVCCL